MPLNLLHLPFAVEERFSASRWRPWCAGALLAGVVFFVSGCRVERSQPSTPSDGEDGKAAQSPVATPHRFAAPEEQTVPASAESLGFSPAGLGCLARAYGAQTESRETGWALVLPTGARFLWDDGQQKSHEERLAASDLQDMMQQSYPAGAVVAVSRADWDPGRARSSAFFGALYGKNESEVRLALVKQRIAGHEVLIHHRAAGALERVAHRLQPLLSENPRWRKYFEPMGGTFNYRNIAGTVRPSAHSWGIALDLNPALGDYHLDGASGAPWKNRVPAMLVNAFEAEGFIWGGRWRHFDTMHFEFRPELLDPACRAGASLPTTVGASWMPPPESFSRVEVSPGSFGAYLRTLRLLPPGSEVISYRGETILEGADPRLAAVVDLDIGEQDLQQCADAIIRLHAEWAFAINRPSMVYRAGDGTSFDFQRYLAGERVTAVGGKLQAKKTARPQPQSRSALRAFLQSVFAWVNTRAVEHFAQKVATDDIAPGDFFVMSGNPFGHAVLVLDVAQDDRGKKMLLLGQSYMPAQSFHILRASAEATWFELDPAKETLDTPFWQPFPLHSLRRFL